MKYFIFFMFPLLQAVVQAQTPQIRVYAYSREITPGIIPDPGNDSIKKMPPVQLPKVYHIYAEIKKGYRVHINTAFIDGQYYHVSMQKVKTPVIKDRYEGMMNSDQKDLLVKRTANDVYEIKLGNTCLAFTGKKNADTMRTGKAVMLIADYKKTTSYPGLPEIKMLSPVQGM